MPALGDALGILSAFQVLQRKKAKAFRVQNRIMDGEQVDALAYRDVPAFMTALRARQGFGARALELTTSANNLATTRLARSISSQRAIGWIKFNGENRQQRFAKARSENIQTSQAMDGQQQEAGGHERESSLEFPATAKQRKEPDQRILLDLIDALVQRGCKRTARAAAIDAANGERNSYEASNG